MILRMGRAVLLDEWPQWRQCSCESWIRGSLETWVPVKEIEIRVQEMSVPYLFSHSRWLSKRTRSVVWRPTLCLIFKEAGNPEPAPVNPLPALRTALGGESLALCRLRAVSCPPSPGSQHGHLPACLPALWGRALFSCGSFLMGDRKCEHCSLWMP